MDTLHTVLRSIRGETKSSLSHLDVFREFLTHLEKANRKAAPRATIRGKSAAKSKVTKRKRAPRAKS